MSKFIQIHTLTAYPLGNPNRDDQGRPKTANFGGVPRLRISSQSIKRAYRTSELFQRAFEGSLAQRTKQIGSIVETALMDDGVDEGRANRIAAQVASLFGTVEAVKPAKSKQGKKPATAEAETAAAPETASRVDTRTKSLVFFSADERARAVALGREIAATNGDELPDRLNLQSEVLNGADTAVDLALFGRMLAASPEFGRDGAAQVFHPITTHKALVEDDFFTAIDDLSNPAAEGGTAAAHLGENPFGSGVFYGYICVDLDLLIANLGGETELALRAVETMIAAAATVTPCGKKNTFAHQTRAGYAMVEIGEAAPRNLATAFLAPAAGPDLMAASIEKFETCLAQFDRAYGACADRRAVMNVAAETGTMSELQALLRNA